MKSSENACSSCSVRIIVSLLTRRIEHSVIEVAVVMRSGCPARLPSPKKSPLPKIATTASFPRVDRQLHLTFLNVKNRVRGTALREDDLFLSVLLIYLPPSPPRSR